MFSSEVYMARREILKRVMKSGVVVFTGNNETPMNYPDNTYHFRQDSAFLYYFGLDFPGLTAIIDLDNNTEIIFGYDFTIDDIIWMGAQESLKSKAAKAGVTQTQPAEAFDDYLSNTVRSAQTVHYLPQYRTDNTLRLAEALNISPKIVNKKESRNLMKAVIAQRSVKENIEIKEIEKALDVTYKMHIYAMTHTKAGMVESEIAGMVEGISLTSGGGPSFPIIFSVHGETLHNHHHDNVMENGRLVVHDAGAETQRHYAGDITRTFPVSGRFTARQKDIYEITLNTQLTSIKAIKANASFKEIHMLAARTIISGLKDIGIMKGDTEEAAAVGAHALFSRTAWVT